MQSQINTVPLQQFIQQVKAADLGQQREIKLDIKTAKSLAYCLGEINALLVEDFTTLYHQLQQSAGQEVTVQVSGGNF